MNPLADTLAELRALADGEVAKARKGGGKRGTVGAPLPKNAPSKTTSRANGDQPREPAGKSTGGRWTRGSKEWHDNARATMQAQADRAREKNTERAERKMPEVRHGGFKCANCGNRDWREHPVVTQEGKHHATLAFKGCTRCGTMHATQRGVSKTHQDDVGKTVDSTETAAQRQDSGSGTPTDLVGHRTNCPRGGSGPCGAEKDGRCTSCGAGVRDHQALGKDD